jgi:hypothetical protein
MQLDSERIADFKAARDLLHPPEVEEAELKAICAFHEERLNSRLQRVLGTTPPGVPSSDHALPVSGQWPPSPRGLADAH